MFHQLRIERADPEDHGSASRQTISLPTCSAVAETVRRRGRGEAPAARLGGERRRVAALEANQVEMRPGRGRRRDPRPAAARARPRRPAPCAELSERSRSELRRAARRRARAPARNGSMPSPSMIPRAAPRRKATRGAQLKERRAVAEQVDRLHRHDRQRDRGAPARMRTAAQRTRIPSGPARPSELRTSSGSRSSAINLMPARASASATRPVPGAHVEYRPRSRRGSELEPVRQIGGVAAALEVVPRSRLGVSCSVPGARDLARACEQLPSASIAV